jgi:hypothetical protein
LLECLLGIASIVVTVAALEAAFAVLGLRYVPLRLQGDLPQDIRVFAQSSKSGVLPRDPILLLGDSYAQGFGDWLLEADPNRNGPFNSAHVIRQLSGRDVITLGESGAGSAEGMAAFPAIAYAHSKTAWYLRLPPPHVAVVYFYEGNDLNNNMRFLEQQAARPEAADAVERIDRALAAYPPRLFAPAGWALHLPLLRFLSRVARRVYAEQTASQSPETSDPDGAVRAAETDPPNTVEVAGRPMRLPANLQSPAMELTGQEVEQAVLVYDRSLAFLRKLLPGVPVLVVYVPSPLSSYRLLGPDVSIQPYLKGRATRYPIQRVAEDSDRMCVMIRAATAEQGAGFLDLRPAIRAAGVADLVHGPRDFKHFNRRGMEVLGQAVAARIERPLAPESCSAGSGGTAD